jgi:hypothetical protein
MTQQQPVDYVGIELPGNKMMSAHRVKVFLEELKYGILLHSVVVGVSPSRIEVAPQFKLRLTVLDTDGTTIEKVLLPTTKPDVQVITRYVTVDGVEGSLPVTLDKHVLFPVKYLSGNLYFETVITKGQRGLGHVLELV